MICHHPDDDLLLDYASGRLDAAARLVVATHLELCPHCREQVRLLEAVGGVLLDSAEPAELAPEAFARTLARIDALAAADAAARAGAGQPPASAPAQVPPKTARPPLPPGMHWPQSLADCGITPWRWIGPSMRWARVELPHDPQANAFLLRIGAGRRLPTHSHTGLELTQVLHGAFDDGRKTLQCGDFDAADGEVRHQPVVLADGECLCLASLDGQLDFDGWLARLLGRVLSHA